MFDLLGRTVKFVPTLDCEARFTADGEKLMVKGTVIYVNVPHRFFTAQFLLNKDYPVCECFKFSDIGEVVMLCG